MCLTIPAKVIAIEENTATVEFPNIRKEVNIDLLAEVKVGDFVLIKNDVAISCISAEEAKEVFALLGIDAS